MICTKIELDKKLKQIQQLSLRVVLRNRARYFLAKRFLEDYEKFSDVFSQFDDSQEFKVINTNSIVYKQKDSCNILFDSFTITLLQKDEEFYIYHLAEYIVK